MGIKNSDDGNKKPFLYYYIIVLLVVMVLNALVFPSMMERSMEVPFSEFTAQLDAGNIKEAYVSRDCLFVKAGGGSQTPVVCHNLQDRKYGYGR